MYEQYQGYALPPPAAIERQMEQLGVPPKQKLRARQTFMKSAIYAGYIDQQRRQIERMSTSDSRAIPGGMEFGRIPGISREFW